MKKKILFSLSVLLLLSINTYGQKKKQVPMGTFVAESQFKDFIPISPMELEQTVIIFDKTKNKFDTLSIQELSANKDLTLQFLPNETVYATVKKVDNAAVASFGPASLSAEQGSYTITLDYGKFTTLKILNGTTCAGFAKVGIGMRITAQITTFKAGVDISSLFGLAIAANTNQLKGQLSIDIIGMESGKITDLITLPVDISPASIQTALQSMSAIKSKIYEPDTRLYPQVIAIKRANEFGNCSVFSILNTLEVPDIGAKERGYNDGRAMRTLIDGIKTFYQNNRRYPNNLDEINAPIAITALKKERLEYRTDNERGFILRFAGADSQLNT